MPARRSINKPPSVELAPAVECPPPLTATSISCSLAYLSAMPISSAVLGTMLTPAGFSAALDQRSIEMAISGSDGEKTLAVVADKRSRRAVMSVGVVLRLGVVEVAAILCDFCFSCILGFSEVNGFVILMFVRESCRVHVGCQLSDVLSC